MVSLNAEDFGQTEIKNYAESLISALCSQPGAGCTAASLPQMRASVFRVTTNSYMFTIDNFYFTFR